ncbi:hypothetical protein GCM10023238_00780 [Streptomyces heliomycini]
MAEGACVVVADLNAESAAAVAEELGRRGQGRGGHRERDDEEQIADAFKAAALAFGGVDLVVNNAGISISKPLLETSAKDWDLQHDIMARGSFLVSREAARVMIAQELGGDIVYIASKNAVFAGPNNIAYSATKADQAHQVRLLAAELGEHGIRGQRCQPGRRVVRGSGIFAGGWGAQRAATYASRRRSSASSTPGTILKREVLPEHVANAVFALTGGELTHTTGCTSRSTPASPPPSCDERVREVVRRGRPGRVQRTRHGRPRRPRHAGADRGAPLPQPSGAGPRRAALGHPGACTGASWKA